MNRLKWNQTTRDTILFFIGVGGTIQQTFFVTTHDPILIGFLAALLGLPYVLRRDEQRNSSKEKE